MRASRVISAIAAVTVLVACGGCARLGVVGLERRSATNVELTIAGQNAMHPQPANKH